MKWLDGQNILAIATSEGTIEIWSTNEPRRLRQITHNTRRKRVSALSWNKHILSAGGADGRIVHFDVRIRDANIGESHYHQGEVTALIWNRNENILASASSNDPNHSIAIWDMIAFCQRHRSQEIQRPSHPIPSPQILRAHAGAIYDLAWQPGSTTNLYSASGDKTIKKWNIISENPLKETYKASGIVTRLLFDKNRNLMATIGKYFVVFNRSWKKLYQSITNDEIPYSTIGEDNQQSDETHFLSMTLIPGTNTVACSKKDETICFFEPRASKAPVKRKRKADHRNNNSRLKLLKNAQIR